MAENEARVTREHANQLGFDCVGELRFDEAGLLYFSLQNDYKQRGAKGNVEGWVYLWVKEDEAGRFEICYVGKAGRTLEARCRQHMQGFAGRSSRGKELARLVGQYLGTVGRRLQVYARKSLQGEIFGECVSYCEIEERAMLAKIRRLGGLEDGLWNIQ